MLTDALKTFYKELVELTIDFMSNNMFFDNSANSQLNSLNNHNQFFVDIYSNSSVNTGSSYLRINSLLETPNQPKNNVQTRQWLIGNKIVQIKTGLYYNICQEDLGRKRVNSVNKEQNVNNSQTNAAPIQTQTPTVSTLHSKLIPTSAIDIPTNSNNAAASVLNSGLINDSMASSNNSSTSVSNNNSYSSISLTSNVTTPMSTVAESSNLLSNENVINKNLKNVAEKNSDSLSLNSCGKSEQDFFDETIDCTDTNLVNNDAIKQRDQSIEQIDGLNSQATASNEFTLRQGNANGSENGSNGSQITRRNRLKRRYKSGLPLTTDRNENDVNEDLYLKEYFDYTMSKQSKDDSGI